MQFLILNLFSSVYGEGNYGDCPYSEGCVDDSSVGGAGSGLADTGIWIVAIATLACLLIFIALLARWIASRNNKKMAAPAPKTKKALSKKK